MQASATLKERCQETVRRWFRPRDLIIRTDGRIHCLSLSTRAQAAAAVGVVVAAIWIIGSVAGLLASSLRGEEADLMRASRAYGELLAETQDSYRELASIAGRLTGRSDGVAPSSEADDDSAATLERHLVRFQTRLDDIVALNRTLSGEMEKMTLRLARVEREKGDLTAIGARLAAQLGGLRNDVGKGRGENQKLRRQVAGLASQLAIAERTEVSLRSAVQLADAGLAPGGGNSIAKSVGYPIRKLFNGDGPEDALVLAVMKQESAFDPMAVSSKGAMGIMQLMPDTAKQVAGKLKLSYSKSKLTQNADFNIALGRAYLDQLLNLFDRSYVLAIAAYNAGPQRVLEWMRAYGDPRDNGVDITKWVASIPYAETRNYVRRVMGSLEQYRDRLAGETSQDRCFSLVNVSW
jgi:hypothetical protein